MRTDGQTNTTKLIVTSRNFVRTPKTVPKNATTTSLLHIMYKKYKDLLHTTIIEFHVARVQKKNHIRQVLVYHNLKWPNNATTNVRVPASCVVSNTVRFVYDIMIYWTTKRMFSR